MRLFIAIPHLERNYLLRICSLNSSADTIAQIQTKYFIEFKSITVPDKSLYKQFKYWKKKLSVPN